MIINEARINEVKSINVGDGATAYQYGGKYFIKKNGEKKEISADQYNKLISRDSKSSKSDAKDNKSTNKVSNEWVNKLEDVSMSYDDLVNITQDSGDEWGLEEINRHIDHAGFDPDRCLFIDGEAFYDLGSGYGPGAGIPQIKKDFDNLLYGEASSEEEYNSPQDEKDMYSNSRLYKFNDGSKILEINIGGGYESGVPLYVLQK